MTLRGMSLTKSMIRPRIAIAGLLAAVMYIGLQASASAGSADTGHTIEKIDLWDNSDGPHLRGAVIGQRRRYPDVDGKIFIDVGPIGLPRAQEDFDRLSAAGANAVLLNHPGLFTEDPPYRIDPVIQANLDNLLEMAERADLFAVISFSTGPERSFFTFFVNAGGTWFDESKYNDAIWGSQEAQDAWLSMWRHVAERYRDKPFIVGYELMVEPNSNIVGSDILTDKLNIRSAKEFHTKFGGTLYDWNQLYPRITAAIREVDPDTPILIGGNNFNHIGFLPYVKPTGDPRTVYVFHNYDPFIYTHQGRDKSGPSYPGEFDATWDKRPDKVDKEFLDRALARADAFVAEHGVDVAVTEFGVMRWAPGSPAYLADQMAIMERRGFNNFVYSWSSSYRPVIKKYNFFNYRFGTEASNNVDQPDNPLMKALKYSWSRNRLRPSNVTIQKVDP